MFENFNIDKFIYAIVYVLIAVIFYFIITRIINLVLQKPREKLGNKLSTRQKQRMDTYRTMLCSVAKYVVIVALILALLANFGVDVSSLLAGLGIATAIIGLAFQDLGKDIIAGFGIVSNNLYEVGDLIEIDGFKGRVTEVNLKNTRIKNYRGKELIVANRKMNSVINYSTYNTLAQVDIPVPYDADSEHVSAVLEKVCEELKNAGLEQIVGEVDYYGPIEIKDSAIIWRVTAECEPYKHFKPQRTIRRLVLSEFKKARIKIPYNQLDIHSK